MTDIVYVADSVGIGRLSGYGVTRLDLVPSTTDDGGRRINGEIVVATLIASRMQAILEAPRCHYPWSLLGLYADLQQAILAQHVTSQPVHNEALAAAMQLRREHPVTDLLKLADEWDVAGSNYVVVSAHPDAGRAARESDGHRWFSAASDDGWFALMVRPAAEVLLTEDVMRQLARVTACGWNFITDDDLPQIAPELRASLDLPAAHSVLVRG